MGRASKVAPAADPPTTAQPADQLASVESPASDAVSRNGAGESVDVTTGTDDVLGKTSDAPWATKKTGALLSDPSRRSSASPLRQSIPLESGVRSAAGQKVAGCNADIANGGADVDINSSGGGGDSDCPHEGDAERGEAGVCGFDESVEEEIDIETIEEQLKLGQAMADAAALRTGMLGGVGVVARVGWSALAVVAGGYGLWMALVQLSSVDANQRPRPPWEVQQEFSEHTAQFIGVVCLLAGIEGLVGAGGRVFLLTRLSRTGNAAVPQALQCRPRRLGLGGAVDRAAASVAADVVSAHLGAMLWFNAMGLLIVFGWAVPWCAQRYFLYSGKSRSWVWSLAIAVAVWVALLAQGIIYALHRRSRRWIERLIKACFVSGTVAALVLAALSQSYEGDRFKAFDLQCANKFCEKRVDACVNSPTCFAMIGYATPSNATERVPILAYSLSGDSDYDALLRCARVGAGTTSSGSWGNFYEEWYGSMRLSHLSYGAAAFFGAISVGTFWFYFKARRDAARIVAADHKRYDARWADITSDPDAVAALQLLNADTEAAVRRVRALQAGGEEPSGRAEAVVRDVMCPAFDRVRPVQLTGDLVQLYRQAAKLNPHFQNRVAEWCAATAAAHPGTTLPLTAAGKPKRLGLKKTSRATQKVFRSYKGKADRVADIVRASIVYPTIEALRHGFATVTSDPTVGVLSVKNRFDPDASADGTAGYRNLALLLVVVDAATESKGVHTHVAELQLGLSGLNELRNDQGHKHYVEWRDARAA